MAPDPLDRRGKSGGHEDGQQQLSARRELVHGVGAGAGAYPDSVPGR
ncbi:hypothetical protein A176_002642 [Myxococcus hansupus]|uniref:Uncharacterized protein n=1 Tax=Pseudomyxococcus hansupus TaxID=1297742 RepID=A0A0H4WWK8_9BACT|nr:hypothetical protein A176_002642 [Myxococcus hansupus]